MAATPDLSSAAVPTSFRNTISKPVVASFMAGGVAGAVSRTVVSPLERLKILQQIQAGARNQYQLSIWKALGKMWKEEGWRGFMAGNGTNCVRIVPYSAVQFGSYNFYKRVRRTCGGCVGWAKLTWVRSFSRRRLAQIWDHYGDFAVEV